MGKQTTKEHTETWLFSGSYSRDLVLGNLIGSRNLILMLVSKTSPLSHFSPSQAKCKNFGVKCLPPKFQFFSFLPK